VASRPQTLARFRRVMGLCAAPAANGRAFLKKEPRLAPGQCFSNASS
jgi:hypothetical protein